MNTVVQVETSRYKSWVLEILGKSEQTQISKLLTGELMFPRSSIFQWRAPRPAKMEASVCLATVSVKTATWVRNAKQVGLALLLKPFVVSYVTSYMVAELVSLPTPTMMCAIESCTTTRIDNTKEPKTLCTEDFRIVLTTTYTRTHPFLPFHLRVFHRFIFTCCRATWASTLGSSFLACVVHEKVLF